MNRLNLIHHNSKIFKKVIQGLWDLKMHVLNTERAPNILVMAQTSSTQNQFNSNQSRAPKDTAIQVYGSNQFNSKTYTALYHMFEFHNTSEFARV